MIACIAAIDKKCGMGKNGKLPWHYSEDLKFFKNTTADSVCIMGKNTFLDMIPYFNNKIFMPGRVCLVISTTLDISQYPDIGVKVFTSVINAFAWAKLQYPDKNVFFIGGKSIYEECIPLIDYAIINIINGVYDCDTFFPYSRLLDASFGLISENKISDNVYTIILGRNKNENM